MRHFKSNQAEICYTYAQNANLEAAQIFVGHVSFDTLKIDFRHTVTNKLGDIWCQKCFLKKKRIFFTLACPNFPLSAECIELYALIGDEWRPN